MAEWTQVDIDALRWRMDAIIHHRPTVIGGPTQGETNQVRVQFAQIQAKLDAILVNCLALAEAQGIDSARLVHFTDAARTGEGT